MARQLTVRRPNAVEMRQLRQILEESSDARLCRWAEALLFCGADLNGRSIAEALGLHVNTIYICLHGFARLGMSLFECVPPQGAPSRIRATQVDEIARVAGEITRVSDSSTAFAQDDQS